MKEFKIIWQCTPFNCHSPKTLFVEADNEDTAKAVAKDHVERTYGHGGYGYAVRSVSEYTRPTGGRVVA